MDNNKEKVNLLPEEMRGKEEKELEKVRKNPHLVEIEMTDPKGSFVFRDKEGAKGGPGFWRSLFKAKPQEAFDSVELPVGFALDQKSVKEKAVAAETPDIAVKQTAKKPSLWQRLFGASEEKERRRIEKLALMRAKQEAAYRQKEAAKRAKLENKMRQQQDKQRLIEKKKQETEARQQMIKISQREKTEKEKREAKEHLRQEKAKPEVKKIETPPVKPVFKPMPPPPPPPPPPKKPALPERPGEEKIIRTEAPPRGKAAGLDVNLIPEELVKANELKLSRQLLNLSGVILIVLAIIGGAYGWLMSYQTKMNNKIKAVDEQISQINSQVSKYQKFKEEVTGYQSRLKDLDSLLGSHIFWTKFFSLLAAHTVPEVYYESLAAQTGASVTLSAKAKSYEALARQLVAFQQADDLVQKVSITSASAQLDAEGAVSGVSFSVNLTFKPEVFLKYATGQK